MEEPKVFRDLMNTLRTAHAIADPREKRLYIRASIYLRLEGMSDEQARLLALLEHGADTGDLAALREALAGGLTCETKLWQETPLGLAIRRGQIEAVGELLKRGANPNVDSEGYPPLFVAAGEPEMLELLIQAGADVARANGEGYTALIGACHLGTAAGVKILIDAGAKIDEMGNMETLRGGVAGMTPLMVAGWFADAAKVKVLIAAGADLNLKDAEGHTALNWAQMKTSKRCVKIAEMLIKAGAVAGRPVVDVDAPKPDFRKAAKEPGFLAAVERLKEIAGKPKRRLEGVEGPIRGGVGFLVTESRAKEIVVELQTELLGQGCYLFATCDMTDRNGDAVALLPTADVHEVIAAIETEGPDAGVYTGDLIRWLKALEDPVRITGVGRDYIEGKFTAPIKDAAVLARKINKICPDGDESADSERALAQRLESTGELHLWWD